MQPPEPERPPTPRVVEVLEVTAENEPPEEAGSSQPEGSATVDLPTNPLDAELENRQAGGRRRHQRGVRRDRRRCSFQSDLQ